MGHAYTPNLRFPVGVILPYVATEVPNQLSPGVWLPCDGREILREHYAALFALIGTTYGEGDGSSTFNIPDLRGRVVLGLDNLGGVPAHRVTAAAADAPGGSGGAEQVVLAEAHLPSHTHALSSRDYDFGDSAVYGADNGRVANAADRGGAFDVLNTAAAGGGEAHENLPPYLALGFIIRVRH